MSKIQDEFEILRKIHGDKRSTQRKLSTQLGFSLGNDSENKIGYMYALTPRGMRERTKLTINYMKQKMIEYDELKKELNQKK